ncbi:MAG: hypothetical protein MJ168_06765 [Clostridia bacterium]|nr:hypothetical protein [Clostridia bacterium]
MYVNGVLISSESATPLISFPSNEDAQFLCIGGDSSYNGETEARFTGKIVTANVYGRALTVSEINELYSQYTYSNDSFDFIHESGYVFDSKNMLLYGMTPSELTTENIKNAFTNENLYVETECYIGTGTKIVLKNSRGEVYNSAEILVFGDVNGDGWYDGMDSIIVSCLATGLISKDMIRGVVWRAADCNHDGVIDGLDVELLRQAGLLLENIDQSKPTEELLATSSEYVQYLNLIDQTAEVKTSEDINSDEPVNGKICIFNWLLNCIIKILNYIKLHFALI